MIRRLVLDTSSPFQPPADLLLLLSSPHETPLIRLRVASWSMFPTLQKGDVLEVEAAHDIRPGDLVVFRRDNVLICHRMTGYGQHGEIFTAGERSGGSGDSVPLSDVLAKVRAISRRGKRVALDRPAAPTVAARLRLWLDRFFMDWKTAWHRWGEAIWERLSRSPRGRVLLSWLIRRTARVHVIGRPPLLSLRASPVVRRQTIRLDEVERTPLDLMAPATEGLRLQVRLGPYWLGACDPASGEVFLRPSVENLGLEQVFHELIWHLEAASTPKDRQVGTRLGPKPAQG